MTLTAPVVVWKCLTWPGQRQTTLCCKGSTSRAGMDRPYNAIESSISGESGADAWDCLLAINDLQSSLAALPHMEVGWQVIMMLIQPSLAV